MKMKCDLLSSRKLECLWIFCLFQFSAGAIFSTPAAAIFGLGANKGDFQGGNNMPPRIVKPREYAQLPPPPPRSAIQSPLPTNLARGGNATTTRDNSETATPGEANQHQVPPPPLLNRPPPPAFYGQPPHQLPPPHFLPPPPPPGWNPPGPWMGPPPPPPHEEETWPLEQQQQLDTNNDLSQLYQDLDDARMREMDFIAQIQNLTAAAAMLEQRDELHVRQLDGLTERVMEVEATAAHEHNLNLEYQANCTQLGRQVATLAGEIEEWKTKCSEYVEKHEKQIKDIEQLKKKLKEASMEAEDLAALIEKHRLQEERETHAKRKSRGFFAWLFGWKDEEAQEWDEVHEAGKSTLLKALQTERDNVEELENAVVALQQNNSAIAEQVKSRDLIIDELNDRISVFEEDKVVLKAALRQLQKEMNEEAPKTQKLVDDLANAQEEIERLCAEVESLIANHQEEVAALQTAIFEKQSVIQETESNLTVIGTYVDKLEERLADFAVARRDIETREKKCQDLESSQAELRSQRDTLQSRIDSLEKEHNELKDLLEELVQERARLRKENRRLMEEYEAVTKEAQGLRSSLLTVENECAELRMERDSLNSQIQTLAHDLKVASSNEEEWKKQVFDTSTEITRLKGELDALLASKNALEYKLQDTEKLRADLEGQMASSEMKMKELAALLDMNEKEKLDWQEERRAIQADAKNRIMEAEAKAKALALRNVRPPPKPKSPLPLLSSDNSSVQDRTQQSSTNELQPPVAQDNSQQEDIFAGSRPRGMPKHDLPPPPPQPIKVTHQTELDSMLEVNNATLAFSNSNATSNVTNAINTTNVSNASIANHSASMLYTSQSEQVIPRPPMNVIRRVYANGTEQLLRTPHSNATNRAMNGTGRIARGPPLNATRKHIPGKGGPPGKPTRKVPFRKLRKFLSKTTGVHGLLTPSSSSQLRSKSGQPLNPKVPQQQHNATWQNEMREKLEAIRSAKEGEQLGKNNNKQ